MPVDPTALASGVDAQRAALVDVQRANMNMVRITGVSVYEDDAFFDACDELGILVWQDVMFANMDPPDDPDFVAGVEAEVSQLLSRVGHRASLAVCAVEVKSSSKRRCSACRATDGRCRCSMS